MKLVNLNNSKHRVCSNIFAVNICNQTWHLNYCASKDKHLLRYFPSYHTIIPQYHIILSCYNIISYYHTTISYHTIMLQYYIIPQYHIKLSCYNIISYYHTTISYHIISIYKAVCWPAGFRIPLAFHFINQKIKKKYFDFLITWLIIDRFKKHASEASKSQSEVGKPPAGARISGGP